MPVTNLVGDQRADEKSAESYRPIGDYAIIGDCRSAALVSREGAIDWLCWPAFASPSIFAALLDAGRGGRFVIQPEGVFRTERRYVPGTNVLETIFHTESGSVLLRDAMPVLSEHDKRMRLTAEREILREVVGLSGAVSVRVRYEPKPGYARPRAMLRDRGWAGIWCESGPGVLVLRGDAPLAVAPGGEVAGGTALVRAGARLAFALTYSEDGPAVIPALGDAARERMAGTIAWWERWIAACTYDGPYREAVRRSVLTLKLMCYAPSGAVVAAPTTSLPERIGGERNWDYRYCWLRDAAFTLRALMALGYEDEAAAYSDWLLHSTRLSWPRLQVLYNVYGETRLRERTLDHLEGYRGSAPVRIGNGAHDQVQLDVYGEVADAVVRVVTNRAFFDRDTVQFLDGIGRTVCDRWREPDSGIWEPRSGPRHYTHSKALCWVALDRLIDLHERFGIALDVARYRDERAALRAEIERHGYNAALGSYTQVFDGDTLDASLLTLPWYGYIEATHPRMASTLARVRERLGVGALLHRYLADSDDGLTPGEGAFGLCSFWAIDCLARGGQSDLARRQFEEMLGYANDVGLFAEEIAIGSGEHLGNFPQAFTHVGVINAALTLREMGDGNAVPPEERDSR